MTSIRLPHLKAVVVALCLSLHRLVEEIRDSL
jgi:hypothetical protein